MSVVHGHLDPIDDQCVRGWAWDPEEPYRRVAVEIYLNGELQGCTFADVHRPDLALAGIGSGRHGFEFQLPAGVLFENEVNRITTNPPLNGAPLVVETFLQGCVESTRDREGVAEGWVVDRANPDRRKIPVNIYADGQRIARGFSSDHSDRFRIPLPNGFDTARVRKWNLRPAKPWHERSDVIDVVVPIYGGIEETLSALEHAAAKHPNGVAFELIAILDNPDDEAMAQALERQQARLRYTLLRNESNLGFVRTVNRGMALHPDRDVVLLNADTRVHGDWLGRLCWAAYDQAHTGTVTPFSNNATICSYPRFCAANPPVNLHDACSKVLHGQTLEIPTAVGFCMYIRRDCLRETGPFDPHTFGKGYGEENDFCMRARRLGWRHMLAADVFVEHLGQVSFGGLAGHSAANAAKLSALHPEYDALVADFIARDPVLPLRRQLDSATATPARKDRVCVATNNLPGGNERFVQELLARLEDPVLLRYHKGRYVTLDAGPNYRFDLPADDAVLADTLRVLGVARLQIQQIVDAPPSLFELGIPYEVTVHDYAWICPQVTLQDETGEYCGEPADIRHCEACYQKLGPHKDWGSLLQSWQSVAELRREHLAVLSRAELVCFPSEDIQARMRRYFTPSRAIVRAHDEARAVIDRRLFRRRPNEPLRVAYIGSLGRAKGFDVLYQLALDALKRDLPIEYTVIGSTVDDRPLEELGVKVLGYYQGDAEAREWLASLEPHLALFPGVLPESYSYTLSLAFETGVYPVSFDLGAIAERIRKAGFGALIPLGSTPVEINDVLLRVSGSPA